MLIFNDEYIKMMNINFYKAKLYSICAIANKSLVNRLYKETNPLQTLHLFYHRITIIFYVNTSLTGNDI